MDRLGHTVAISVQILNPRQSAFEGGGRRCVTGGPRADRNLTRRGETVASHLVDGGFDNREDMESELENPGGKRFKN